MGKSDYIITDSNIVFTNPDYDGIAKVLGQFAELYKVCDNKELLDKCIESFVSPIINPITIHKTTEDE
jgi:hypothetical protein